MAEPLAGGAADARRLLLDARPTKREPAWRPPAMEAEPFRRGALGRSAAP